MKKSMATMMAVVLLGFGLAGCGGGTERESVDAFEQKDPQEYEGTLHIWSWTDDPVYQIELFNEMYPGVTVEFTQIGDEYDTKVQTLVDNGAEGPDIFCADIKVVKNYIDSDAWENLSEKPYHADELADGLIDYVVEAASDADGNLRALSWQASPGGFWYKRSLALEYLGTDDPGEISELFSTMDGFFEAGRTVYEKSGGSTYLLPNYEDIWTMACYSMRESAWVEDGVFKMDNYVLDFFDIARQAREENLDAKLDPWSTPWYGAAEDNSILGYVLPTWGMQYVIAPSAPDSEGDWAIASMPESYFNGGTYMGIYQKSSQKELAWEFLKFVTLNEAYIERYAEEKSDFPALVSVVDELVDGYEDPWCGGQNTFAFFKQEAEAIDTSLITKYDNTINILLLENVKLYVQGDLSKEEAVEQFKEDVRNAYQSLEME